MITIDGFMRELERQRRDDHRYYHQSRINQSLHLLSAISFLCAYALLFIDPVSAVLLAWGVGMVTRQTGHYVFEPAGYDTVNAASNEEKERIKIGYNQRRKTVLIAVWLLSPSLLAVDPALFGLLEPHRDLGSFLSNVALIWLAVALGGILFRAVQLFFSRGIQTGLVWVAKIATDQFHNIRLYYKSPYYLLRGQLLDPMSAVPHGSAGADRQ